MGIQCVVSDGEKMNSISNPVTGADWERVVFAEVLVPDVANVFNEVWTREAVKEAAYKFMQTGFGIDVEHDEVDRSFTDFYVVESFIARDGDPKFIPGSWVVGLKVVSDTIWQAILDGDINGFSYQASVYLLSAKLVVDDSGVRSGTTEPSVEDGHTHEFHVIVDATNRPIAGGTTETNGHSHSISTHTVTDEAAGHVHRYNLVKGVDGL